MNTKIRCILLDDELPGLAYLKMLCEQIPDLIVVKAFDNPATFLNEAARLDFDLCITDIEMPGMNGLQIANLIQGKSIVFTTAYREYAAEAFDIDAVDYIRKPVKMERLQQAVEKVRVKINSGKKQRTFLQMNSDKGKTVLFFNQLAYIKTSDIDSRDKTALLIDGTSIVLKNISFTKLKRLLPADQFVQINKQELIALKIVRLFSSDEITTNLLNPVSKDPLKLSLSEVYRADFLKYVAI